jgi:hypothetical protein
MSDNWERDGEVRQRGKMNEGAANSELRPRQPVEHGEGEWVTGCFHNALSAHSFRGGPCVVVATLGETDLPTAH